MSVFRVEGTLRQYMFMGKHLLQRLPLLYVAVGPNEL
jgi:hypothetical protein